MAWFKRKKDDLTAELDAYQKAGHPAVPPAGTQPSAAGEMTVQDVFSITGRGLVATGVVTSGTFAVGNPVRVVCKNGDVLESTITGLETFGKLLQTAAAGAQVGMLLRGLTRGEVTAGDIIYQL